MRDLRPFVFLIVGLLLAGLTGVALYGIAERAASGGGTALAASPTVEVLVASSDLPARTTLTTEHVSRRSYPVELVPTGAIANESDAVGKTTVAPVARGQTIVRSQLSSANSSRAASTSIEKGKVLVAFATADPLTTAGLINVGDHVDILASVVVGTGESARVSQTTMQDLEVLDIITPSKEQPQRATSLVFAVDHQVALVLKYLRDAQASVDVVIRSRTESELTRTTGVDLTYLVTTYGFRR